MWIVLHIFLAVLLKEAYSCPPIYGNCYIFDPKDEWNRPIGELPVDTDPIDYQNSCILAGTSPLTSYLRLDLGTDPINEPYGMRSNIFTSTPPCLTHMAYGTGGTSYQPESDWIDSSGKIVNMDSEPSSASNAFFPFPVSAVIEGSTPASRDPTSGDRHVLVLDAVNCMLYESWNSMRDPGINGWMTTNTAVWNLTSPLLNKQRTAGYTSADAAGMAIFPGVLKYAEVAKAVSDGTMIINHALRFTAPHAQNAYSNPGRHFGPNNDITLPYYGARFRLMAGFSESGYSADTIVLIRTLKKYGIIFSDQGSGPWITSDNDAGYGNHLQNEINSGTKRILWSNFELVQSSDVITRGWSPPSVSCSGISQNINGTFVPTWQPNCPSPPLIQNTTKTANKLSLCPIPSSPPTTLPPPGGGGKTANDSERVSICHLSFVFRSSIILIISLFITLY